MRSLIVVVALAAPAAGADLGSPVPLPRPDSPAFAAEVVAKLAEIDARLARMEAATQAAPAVAVPAVPFAPGPAFADCPTGNCPAARSGTRVTLAPGAVGVSSTWPASPVEVRTYTSVRGVGSCGNTSAGPVRRLFGRLFGGGCGG